MVFRHPRWFLAVQLVFAIVCLAYTKLSLRLSVDKNDLISVRETYRRQFLDFKAEFAPQDNMFVLVESEDPRKSRDFIGRLTARLQADDRFTNIYCRGGLPLLGAKALLFLPEPSLAELEAILREHQAMLRSFSRSTNLESLLDSVNRQFRRLSGRGSTGINREALARSLPALQRLVDDASDYLVSPVPPPPPDFAALFGSSQKGALQGQYLTFDQGRIYVVIAQPRSPAAERAAILQLRTWIDRTRPEVPGVNAEVTGEAVLRSDEMEQARRDTEVAALISLGLTALAFVGTCRAVMRPLLATLCLLIGLSYTLGFATLAVGSLNILSITLVPILIGLAIDYGVHLIFRYEEQVREGHSPDHAVRTALAFTGIGVITSALTIAASFYFMVLTDFKGIREMGLIAGSGILVCLVPMLTLLPLLLVRSDPGPPSRLIVRGGRPRRERIEQSYLRHPRLVLLLGALLTGFMTAQAFKVRFDYNLLDLQSRGSPSVRIQKRLIQSGSHSLLYCAVIAESLSQAVDWERRIQQLPSVARVVSMVRFLAENQDGKLALIRAIREEVVDLRPSEPDPRPADLPRVSQALYSLGGYLGRAIEMLRSEGTDESQRLAEQLRSLRRSVARLQHLTTDSLPTAVQRLSTYQRALLGSFRESLALIQHHDDLERLQAADVPAALRQPFIGRTGRYLLQVYPKEDVWQREQQDQFIRELRSVAPNVTGSPVLFFEYTTRLKRSVERAAASAAVIVAILVFLHFRRWLSALLALLPVGVGFSWMLGVMGWLGIPFNPVNVMSLILIIGIGVANGVHILNRFTEDRQPVILSKSTGKAVLVSAFSTMAGFGSLMIAKHQGIASLGAVMTIGTATCTVASLALLPAALRLLLLVGWRPDRP